MWTTTHLRAHLGHFFILGNSTVSCRLLPCCSGSTTGAALPLAELGRWAVEVGSAGNCPGQPGTSHTSPPTTYPPPHLSTGAIKPRILIQTYALAQKLILKAQRPKNPGGLVALPSGKFLRVTLEIALGSFQPSGKFPDSVNIFRKLSRLSRKFPLSLESFQIVRIFSGWSGYFPDGPESFRIAWKVSG